MTHITPPQQQESEEEMAAKYADQIPEGYAVTACEVEVAALWGLRKGKEISAEELERERQNSADDDIIRTNLRTQLAALDTAAQETAKDYHALEVERDRMREILKAFPGLNCDTEDVMKWVIKMRDALSPVSKAEKDGENL